MPTTLEWLRARADRDLVALLRARPDLTVPAPGDLTVLAGRLNTGPSVWRAMESLNQFHIQILQGLAVLGAEKRAAARQDLIDLLGPGVSPAPLDQALALLESLALLRGTERIQMPSAVLAVLGPYPAGLGAPGTLSVSAARTALDGLDPTSRGHPGATGQRNSQRQHRFEILDRPRGHRPDQVRPAAPGRRRHRRIAARSGNGAARCRAARPHAGAATAGRSSRTRRENGRRHGRWSGPGHGRPARSAVGGNRAKPAAGTQVRRTRYP